MNKKILVLGGTGALGVYLVEALVKAKEQVDVISLDEKTSANPLLRYIRGNAMDDDYLLTVLKNGYDAVVDFMLYPSKVFAKRYKMLLKNTGHYIFLSSYRIYAGDFPITESSPRLLETNKSDLINPEDYSVYKAMEEDMLRQSGARNFTVIRPAITYSKRRFQLTILEAPVLIYRMRAGKTVYLPAAAINVQATMSWSGDVAKMIQALILNEQAFGETYTVSTAEHHTWGEIAEMYRELGGLKCKWINTEDFIRLTDKPGSVMARRQLLYDRLFHRVINNSKILNISGLKQEQLMPLKKGLKMELDALPKDYEWPYTPINDRMDHYEK